MNAATKKRALGIAAGLVVGVLSFWLAWKLAVQEPAEPQSPTEAAHTAPAKPRGPVQVPLAEFKTEVKTSLASAPLATVSDANRPGDKTLDLRTAAIMPVAETAEAAKQQPTGTAPSAQPPIRANFDSMLAVGDEHGKPVSVQLAFESGSNNGKAKLEAATLLPADSSAPLALAAIAGLDHKEAALPIKPATLEPAVVTQSQTDPAAGSKTTHLTPATIQSAHLVTPSAATVARAVSTVEPARLQLVSSLFPEAGIREVHPSRSDIPVPVASIIPPETSQARAGSSLALGFEMTRPVGLPTAHMVEEEHNDEAATLATLSPGGVEVSSVPAASVENPFALVGVNPLAVASTTSAVVSLDLALVPPQLPTAILKGLARAPLAHPWLPVYSDGPLRMAPTVPPFEDMLPEDPLLVARSYSATEPALLLWLERWAGHILWGQANRLGEDSKWSRTLSELGSLLAQTSLTCTQIYEIGRGIGWVEGEVVATRCSSFAWVGGEEASAAQFYRAAISKAEVEMRLFPAGDQEGEPIVHALSRMAGFWDIGDFVSLERVYRLLKEQMPPGSLFALNAEYLQAESFHELGRGGDKSASQQAATICREMLSRPDVLRLKNVDRASVHFMLACALYQAGEFAESVTHYYTAAMDGGRNTPYAHQFYIIALARAGRLAEAKHEFNLWVTRVQPLPQAAQYVFLMLAQAESSRTTVGESEMAQPTMKGSKR